MGAYTYICPLAQCGKREVGDIVFPLKILYQTKFCCSVDFIFGRACGTGQNFRKILCCLCGTDNTRPRIITCIQDNGTIRNLSVETAFAAGVI